MDPDGRLWAISTRLQSFLLGTLNPQEINFRVFGAASSAQAVRGTACERGGHSAGGAAPPENIYGGQNQLVFRP